MTTPVKRPKIVAVDGPAGSGKSSICATVSERLGWTYVNTGAIYRALAVLARQQKINLSDAESMEKLVDVLSATIRWDSGGRDLIWNGQNLMPYITTAEAGNDASLVAKIPSLRALLLPLQRQLALAAPHGAIVDGRDIGTVVFPDADLKIFMTASLEERARRRLRQLVDQGLKDGRITSDYDAQAKLDDIRRDISLRDEQDTTRAAAPLKICDDAVVIDTSDLSLSQAIEALEVCIRNHHLS